MGMIISKLPAASTYSSLIFVTHLVNGAQFLKTTLVVSLPPVIRISPVTKNMHQNNHIN